MFNTLNGGVKLLDTEVCIILKVRKVWRPTGESGGWRRAVRCEILVVRQAALPVRLPL